jgi:hypothetical protein
MTLPLRSSPITGPSSLLRSGPPLCPASVLNPSRISRLGLSLPPATAGPCWRHWPPAGARRQVPTFRTEAQTKLTPPPCRTPPGQSAGSRQAHPGPSHQTRFRCRPYQPFDTSSVDRSRSSSWPTPDALNGAPFPTTLTTTALDRSSSGRFAASPCRTTAEDHRPRPGRPLHLRCSTASISSIFYIDFSLLRSWHT